ncbi:hypothetical protein D3C74_379230 [compost metagenome]
MHAQDPAAEADGHEQANLGANYRNTDGTSGLFIAADGEDPVADFGAEQDPRGHDDQRDPDEDSHLHIDSGNTHRRSEDCLGTLETVHVCNGRRGDRAADGSGQAQVQSCEHQEAGQSHDEGWQFRLDQDDSVDESDQQRNDQRQDDTDPDIHAEIPGNQRGAQGRGDHRDTGGQVEFATDHQQ